MRRSGNHALIGWLVNALEHQQTELIGGGGTDYWVSSVNSGRVLFLNEINWLSASGYLHLLWRNRGALRTAKAVIISTEDVDLSYSDCWRLPRQAEKIVVRRSTLNIIASRLRHAVDTARLGKGRGDMIIDRQFFEKLLTLARSDPSEWIIWDYDRWLAAEGTYRSDVLARLGLSFDHHPHMPREGGGSSFSGRDEIPTPEQASGRWKKIEWPDRVLNLLRDPKYSVLLTEDEERFVRFGELSGS